MPKPHSGESKDEYVSRCAGAAQMNKEFPDQKQRVAVCYSYWERKNEAEEKTLTFKQFLIANTDL